MGRRDQRREAGGRVVPSVPLLGAGVLTLDQDRILVFHTPPAEKSDGSTPGKRHQAVSHQIKTYRPQFAICCRNESVAGKLTVGSTLVVCPRPLNEGYYAVLDTVERTVAHGDVR